MYPAPAARFRTPPNLLRVGKTTRWVLGAPTACRRATSPLPADELVVDDESGGSRPFLSGPLEFGLAMLITPSCSLGAQGTAGYGHPVRTLVPVLPLAELVERGVVKETALDDLRRFDHLINYMYLPPLDVDELDFSMPESAALLYMPVTLHHVFLEASASRNSRTAVRNSCSGSSCGSLGSPATDEWPARGHPKTTLTGPSESGSSAF